MTTVAEALAARRQSRTAGDMLAERDRTWERDMMIPPIDGNAVPESPIAYSVRNPVTPTENTGDPTLRRLQVALQGAGRGMADLAGTPVDLTAAALDLGALPIEMATGADIPNFSGSPVGGGNFIADTASSLLPDGALIDKADMTSGERMTYEGNRFGTQGAVGGTILATLAKSGLLPRAMTAPYEAGGSMSRVVAGDTAAGVGSGLSMEAYRQYAPEEMQGPIGEFIMGLVGGVGGATLPGVAERAATGTTRAATGGMAVPEEVFPRDPVTMMPVSRGDLSRAAALYQNQALDPQKASLEIGEYLRTIGSDGPAPTAGVVSNDPGLLTAERRMRATSPEEFIQRDREVMNDVSARVSSTRPEGADPAKARTTAATSIEEQLAQARERPTQLTAQVSEQEQLAMDLAAALQNNRGLNQASRDLDRVLVDETYLPARGEKNRLYDEAAANPNVVVGTENSRQRAAGEADRMATGTPELVDPESRRIADAFARFRGTDPTGETMPSTDGPEPRIVRSLSDVMEDRRRLSEIESGARAQGNFGRADTARTIRGGLNEDVRAAAESGVPGTERLAAADTNYRERFAPYFREGTVAPDFFRRVDRDSSRNQTVPEATAGKFLTAGPTSRAAAEDVARILEIAPNPESGKAAVREYVKADAVSKGVIGANGEISEQALARFMSQREGMFSVMPELRAEFDTMLSQVRTNRADVSRLRAELADAAKEANLTEEQLNKGALKIVMDYEPRKAVEQVFSAPDSPAAMREIVAGLKDTPDAAEGWKAAVVDYFVDKVTTASKAGVSDGADTVSLPALRRTFEQNENALAEVFSPEEMNSLRQAQTTLEIMSRRGAQATTGSATAENFGPLGNLIMAFAQPAGAVTLLNRGALMAGSVERRIRMVAQQFPDADAAAKQIMARATFDPKLAQHLLNFPTADEQVYAWSKRLNQLIVAAEAGRDDGEEPIMVPRQPLRMTLDDPGNQRANSDVDE